MKRLKAMVLGVLVAAASVLPGVCVSAAESDGAISVAIVESGVDSDGAYCTFSVSASDDSLALIDVAELIGDLSTASAIAPSALSGSAAFRLLSDDIITLSTPVRSQYTTMYTVWYNRPAGFVPPSQNWYKQGDYEGYLNLDNWIVYSPGEVIACYTGWLYCYY